MAEQDYLSLLSRIVDTGERRLDRTGTGTVGVFAPQLRFDLAEGFPLLTTKRVPLRLVVGELLWFMQGITDKRWLTERNNHIWDEWSAPGHPDHIGPGYGWQFRCAGAEYDPDYAPGWQHSDRGVDQLADVIWSVRANPMSRRHIVSSWNPMAIPDMALPPCHAMFQFHVSGERLHCQLYQRSADMFLGVPFNIASYALLTHIVAREVGLGVGEFVWTAGDAHVYLNHLDAVATQVGREPRALPTLHIADDVERRDGDILPRYEVEHFTVSGYDPHPTIKAEVSV